MKKKARTLRLKKMKAEKGPAQNTFHLFDTKKKGYITFKQWVKLWWTGDIDQNKLITAEELVWWLR